MSDSVACVACAELIKVQAKLCKHCGTLQNDARFQRVEEEVSVDAVIDKSIELFPARKFSEGLGLLDELVRAGDPNALANAGWAHHELGDDLTALKLLVPAAEAGHFAAMWNIVMILDVDGCTAAQRKTYRKWLSALSEAGDSNADMYLYQDYMNRGQEDKAVEALIRAAKAGNEDAEEELKTWDFRPTTISFPTKS